MFRTTLSLAEPLPHARWWISASQRFRCWINGELVAQGPSRADPEQWGCVPVEVDYLDAGDHQIAIEVVHWGPHAGKGQIGKSAFLLVASDDPALRDTTTAGRNWLCHLDSARKPAPHLDRAAGGGHRAIGPGEDVDGRSHPWNWQTHFHPDWRVPTARCPQLGNPWGNRRLGVRLVREPLPPMRDEVLPWHRVALCDDGNGGVGPQAHASGALTVPANTSARMILDAGYVTISVPHLHWSGGRGGRIRLTSCEAPIDPDSGHKGQRDTVVGMDLPGQGDRVSLDGGDNRRWQPSWFRAFRYLVVEITAADQPVELHGIERRGHRVPPRTARAHSR